jgi:hypothetical protein
MSECGVDLGQIGRDPLLARGEPESGRLPEASSLPENSISSSAMALEIRQRSMRSQNCWDDRRDPEAEMALLAQDQRESEASCFVLLLVTRCPAAGGFGWAPLTTPPQSSSAPLASAGPSPGAVRSSRRCAPACIVRAWRSRSSRPPLAPCCFRRASGTCRSASQRLPLRGWVAVGQIQCVRWELLRQHMTAAPPAAAAPANSTKVPAAAVPVSTVAHSNNLRMYSLLPKNHTQPH